MKTEYCTTSLLSFSTDIKGVFYGRSYPSPEYFRSPESKTAEKDYALFDSQGLTLFFRSSGKKNLAFSL
ncbi:hypothetical protein [Citrobacter freundii]|uniref:hypothetical protein n=1 Tax=Citrobacter freundii TaxID=546 RepID=UPI001CEFA48D|nr:hypothetical protein [Citrobacter freundii]MDV1774886.1 hypothetical protein [Citrobacter freundii]MEB0391475.1 hypothetical protein [Citrobacter freundii]UDV21388.1 hypothetical protein LJU42_17780 [Citrobacter freundii]UQI37391.1 hypothetical protein M3L74_06265 [Citrobacter freundii]BEJ32925.1 hypothetical protein OIPHN330_15450 [Citrobacter freundii]